MVCLGLALATVLAVASRKLFVYEDPRIDEVEDMLPHANCGACGFPRLSTVCRGRGAWRGCTLDLFGK